jgi:diguanylate cyclase (GGDEF)-like protein
MDAAAVLRKTYRAADIIGRIGGDEFTALPLEAGAENAAALMDRLRKNIDRHNSAQDRPYRLSMSVGVGRFDPGKCQSVRQLMAEADEELYRQKRSRNPSP